MNVLHFAACNGYLDETVRLLVDRGANLDHDLERQGYRLLFFVPAHNGYSKIVLFLMK